MRFYILWNMRGIDIFNRDGTVWLTTWKPLTGPRRWAGSFVYWLRDKCSPGA